MRRMVCVPMILLLILTACSHKQAADKSGVQREQYQSMAGCEMEAEVTCAYQNLLWTGQLRCEYVSDGTWSVEVLAPQTIAGVRAVLQEEQWHLEYEDLVLPVCDLSKDRLNPMTCLPRLMHALRKGWLLEENEENWGEYSCIRLSLDESGIDGKKIVSTLWLYQENGMPLRGEIALDGEIILTAEFTAFAFYDNIKE